MALDPGLLRRLRDLLPGDALLTETADCIPYGYDNSRRQAVPGAVALASSHEQVLELVRLCRRHGVPITPRGRGTGTTGATVPLQGGLVLSLERMDRILELAAADRLLVAEPGATNQMVQDAAGKAGFFWPPDPTSAAFCTLGGNLAYNSAGPRAVKYGTPRENTLGLRAVTGAGEEIRTGVRTTKGVVGYDLTRLLIGSEGTLAIITEATLRLTPLPDGRRTLRAVYADIGAAGDAVARIMAQAVVPCALEFMDRGALSLARRARDLALPADAGALLMIEVDGPADCLETGARRVAAAARGPGLLDLRQATDGQEAAELWQARKALSPALRTLAPKKINEDVVVPVSKVAELVTGLEAIAERFGIPIVNFGHAGNGNIHVNLLVHPEDPKQAARADPCLEAVFDLVLNLGGTLSGEHGVGLAKRPYVARELDPRALALMHALKRDFDPDGILNPGKTLPEA